MMTIRLLAAGALLAGAARADKPAPPAPLPAPAAADPYAPPAEGESLPIDLPTALRLTDAQNPSVGLAEARLREAFARLDSASVLALPTVTVGGSYFRHDGADQNRRGDVFSVSRSNFFFGSGVAARFDVADALYLPLVARRLTDAAAAGARDVRNGEQLEAASGYLDLLRENALLAINGDVLAKAERMLERAEAASRAGLSKTAGDSNRARAEVEQRRQERVAIRGRVGAASARLARTLFLADTVDLRPAEPAVVPVTLVPPQPLESLVALGLANHPALAANRALVAAAETRVRQAHADPFIPKVGLAYNGGGFGGARNANWSKFDGQQELTAQVYWQFDNLGFGNRAAVRLRRAEADQSRFRELEVVAAVRAEVIESAKLASASYRSLGAAEAAVREAAELYRKLEETSFGMVDRKLYDALEPLTAIQALDQARRRYLGEVIEYNRSQFRLYAAMGQPPAEALAAAAPAAPLPAPGEARAPDARRD